MACAINLGSSVIITGGHYTTTVSQYNEAGWLRDLPSLQQGRSSHGCSYYNNNEGTKVQSYTNYYSPIIILQTYLVSGGRGGSHNPLSSTELLVDNSDSWVLAGELPSPRSALKGVNIDNRVIMTGLSECHSLASLS